VARGGGARGVRDRRLHLPRRGAHVDDRPPLATSGHDPGPAGVLPWLHVAHPSGGLPYIADEQGRMVTLHGAIPQGLIDFWGSSDAKAATPPPFYPVDPAAYAGRCPDNSGWMPTPPLCEEDLAQMAALGFNSVRLPLSWSLLEPERGRFDQTYLDRVAQVVDWARAQRLYVIIDMHQNAYGRYLPPPDNGFLRFYTGAPAWATYSDGLPSTQLIGQRELNPAGLEANTSFWYNRAGIQDEYIRTVAWIANRFKDDSTVVGYSVFNEPFPGYNLPPGFEDLLLFPFYRRAIDAITGTGDGLPCWSGFYLPPVCGYRDLGVDDRRHLILLEAGDLREVTDFPTHLSLPVSSYPNLVLSMHAYTHFYTLDHLLPEVFNRSNYPWGGYDQSYALAEKEARAINAALFVSEFGSSTGDDFDLLVNQLHEQEVHRTGFAFWTWKENCAGGWGMFNPTPCGVFQPQPASGCLRATREYLLARVYPEASADPHLTYGYEPSTGGFRLEATARSGDPPTVVIVPPEVVGAISTSGSVVRFTVESRGNGTRVATVYPAGGDFAVTVSPLPVRLTGCT
jgi:endoglycosylceramidase